MAARRTGWARLIAMALVVIMRTLNPDIVI